MWAAQHLNFPRPALERKGPDLSESGQATALTLASIRKVTFIIIIDSCQLLCYQVV